MTNSALDILNKMLEVPDLKQELEDDLNELTPTELRALNWAREHYTQLTDLNIEDMLRVKGIIVGLLPENSVDVFTVEDLPDPIDDVITLADDTLYRIYADVDCGNNQIFFGDSTRFSGSHQSLSILRTSTTLVAFDTNGGSLRAENVRFIQDGTGDLMDIDISSPTGQAKFRECALNGGNVNMIAANAVFLDGVGFNSGARLIQPTGAGTTTLVTTGGTFFRDQGGTIIGLIDVESGSNSLVFVMDQTQFIFQSADSVGINIAGGASFSELSLNSVEMASFGPGATDNILMQLENPGDIEFGTMDIITTQGLFGGGPNSIFRCDPVSSSTSALTGSGTIGVCQDGTGNLIISDNVANTIQRYTLLTNTLNGAAISAPASDVGQLAWNAGVMFSIDSGTTPGRVYFHAGYAAAGVNDFIETPADDPSGVVFVGENMVTTDDVTQQIYVHDGFSTTILETIDVASIIGTPFGLAYDGVNLHIADADDATVKVMRGISSTIQYEFTSKSASLADLWQLLDQGLTPKEVGYVITDSSTDEYHLYDHPVTFDHSAASWEIVNVPDTTGSSDRGGSEFSTTTPVTVTLAGNNLWKDITDSGIAIFYTCFAEFEKLVLSNEQNGEVLWLSTRERGRIIAAQATFSRTGNTQQSFFEIAVVIDGIVQKDSITSGVLANATTSVLTLTTLPISRDIVLGTIIKIQIRRTALSGEPEISFAKIAIT